MSNGSATFSLAAIMNFPHFAALAVGSATIKAATQDPTPTGQHRGHPILRHQQDWNDAFSDADFSADQQQHLARNRRMPSDELDHPAVRVAAFLEAAEDLKTLNLGLANPGSGGRKSVSGYSASAIRAPDFTSQDKNMHRTAALLRLEYPSCIPASTTL